MGRRVSLGILIAGLLVIIGCDDLGTELEEVIKASHGLSEYTLTLSAQTGGSVSPESSTLQGGVAVEISATADSGYTFTNWEIIGGSGTLVIDDSTAATANVSIEGGDVNLRANFTLNPRELTVTTETGGTITTPSSSPVTVADGASTAISVVTNINYVFDGWIQTSGSGTATFTNGSLINTSVSITGGDATIQATFTPATYSLTLTAQTGGTVSPTSTDLQYGDSQSIEATPEGSYTFIGWEQVGGSGTPSLGDSTSASTTVSLSGGDVTLRANFALTPRTITVTAGTGGSISSPTSPVTVDDGASTTISASPDTGYTFSGWTQTGGTGTASFANASLATTTVSVTGGDGTIQANFTLSTYTLTVQSSDTNEGTISIPSSGSAAVTHGVSLNIYCSNPINRGMYFAGWSKVSGTGSASFADASNRYTQVTVTGGDVTVQANYSTIAASLSYVGSYNLDGSVYTSERLTIINDLIVVGDYAYAAGQNPAGGAQILEIDISSKSSPGHSDSWTPGSGEVEDLHMYETTMSVGVSSSSSSIADLYTFTPSSSFSPNDLGFNSSVNKVGGYGYFADGSDHMRYTYSHADLDILSDISSIYYFSDYGCAYVTGYFDMGYGELYSLDHNNSTETFDTYATTFVITDYNASWDYYFYDIQPYDIYLYIAMDDGGLLTLYIDDDPYSVTDRDPRSPSTGNPRFLELAGSSSNYLVALSHEYSSTSDGRLIVYDIHWNNGSQSEPLLIGNRGTVYTAQPRALSVSGDYVYTIEGSYLVIYHLITSTD